MLSSLQKKQVTTYCQLNSIAWAHTEDIEQGIQVGKEHMIYEIKRYRILWICESLAPLKHLVGTSASHRFTLNSQNMEVHACTQSKTRSVCTRLLLTVSIKGRITSIIAFMT